MVPWVPWYTTLPYPCPYILYRAVPPLAARLVDAPSRTTIIIYLCYLAAYGSRKVVHFLGWVPPHPRKHTTFPLPTPLQ